MNERMAAVCKAANSPADVGWWLAKLPYKHTESVYKPTFDDLYEALGSEREAVVALAAYRRFSRAPLGASEKALTEALEEEIRAWAA